MDLWTGSHRTDCGTSGLGVGAPGPGSNGFYAQQRIFTTTTSMAVEQKAYYLEDRWQVSDNWLVTLGIRNDQFTNFNSDHVAYVDSGDQWAPRLGASWDVFGDSSLKLFANLGRYYLALPNSVAIRGASASTYTDQYFTYTGIDANGEPIGLTPFGPGPVSANGEFGQAPNPGAFAPSDLKSQYQDELILGLRRRLAKVGIPAPRPLIESWKRRSTMSAICITMTTMPAAT